LSYTDFPAFCPRGKHGDALGAEARTSGVWSRRRIEARHGVRTLAIELSAP
jgi:hypothetical protein